MTTTWVIYTGIVILLGLGGLFCKSVLDYAEKHGKPTDKSSE